jgi:hypothetical protein
VYHTPWRPFVSLKRTEGARGGAWYAVAVLSERQETRAAHEGLEVFWKTTTPDAPAGMAAIGITSCTP